MLQGADVNLFLASLALEGYTLERFRFDGAKKLSDKEIAIRHAEEAKRLAYCDGGEYKYKVTYEEAERMLARLNVGTCKPKGLSPPPSPFAYVVARVETRQRRNPEAIS